MATQSRSIRRIAVGIALAAASQAYAQKAEVIHWWTSGGESAAVKELADAYGKAGGTWVDAAVAGADNARAAAINRIAGGNPPTAAQFNTSKQYRDLIAEGQLNNIDTVAAREGWDKWLPKPIVDSIKVDGHYYAVPVNIHNPSWFWYSKSALQKVGVTTEPKSMDEMFADLDKLKAAGIVPIAFGGQAWQEWITFYSLLLDVGGKDAYLKFFRDHDAASVNAEPMRRTLATLKKLHGYVDAGSPGRNWNDATAMVISGKAGFQIMGDWAKGEFGAAKQTAGKEYGCFAGFGAGAPYMVAGDVFVFPKTTDKTAIEAQSKLATVFTAPLTQVAFNNKKGSIPVRTDVDVSQMDLCAQAGVAAMKDPARQIANPDMLMSPDMVGAVTDVVTKFWNGNQSIDDAVKALQGALKG